MPKSTSQMFRESRKRHCILFLLLLYQINVIISIYGCCLLQNLEKKKKNSQFNKFQMKVFFHPNISLPYIASPPKYRPTKFALCPYIRPGRISWTLRQLRSTARMKVKEDLFFQFEINFYQSIFSSLCGLTNLISSASFRCKKKIKKRPWHT